MASVDPDLSLFALPAAPPAPRSTAMTKSRFLAGVQCDKRLYFEVNSPEMADPVAEADAEAMAAGQEVGALARQLFPGGVLIETDPTQFAESVAATRAALADPAVPAVFEASFEIHGQRVRVDALVRVGDGTFDLVEAKSSSKPKPEHAVDVAYQLYLLQEIGIPVRSVQLMFPNSAYIRPAGVLDPHDFFTGQDYTIQAKELVPQVMGQVHLQQASMCAAQPPEARVGSHCKNPVKCPFFDTCHKTLTDYPVEQLPRISEKLRGLLADAEIDDIRLIPPDFQGLSPNQARVRDAVVSGVPYLDTDGLAEAFAVVKYPAHFLDFETIQPAIPIYEGTRPYQTIPVQWSNHTLLAKGRVYHKEFLHAEDTDPRPQFLKRLLGATKGEGSIFVYSSFEEKRLRELAADFPEYSGAIDQVIGRFVDLLAILRTHVYYREFHGSHSIKKVLPVLVPGLSYEGMAIGNGSAAAAAFMEIIHPQTSRGRRIEISTALLDYCRLDTEAMLKLYMKLAPRYQEPHRGGAEAPRVPRVTAMRRNDGGGKPRAKGTTTTPSARPATSGRSAITPTTPRAGPGTPELLQAASTPMPVVADLAPVPSPEGPKAGLKTTRASTRKPARTPAPKRALEAALEAALDPERALERALSGIMATPAPSPGRRRPRAAR